MLEVVDNARHEHDGVIDALASLGQPVPCSDRDHELAASVLGSFRAAQRRRARWRVGAVVGLSAAAALVLSWMVASRMGEHHLQVAEGEFLVQQERVSSGSQVAVGQWVEPADARACLKVAGRRVCGESGSRLRVVDDRTVELSRGRLSVDAGLVVLTPIGEVRSMGEGFELVLDDSGETLLLGDTAATLVQDGALIPLAPGARANAAGVVAPQQVAAREVITAPSADTSEPTLVIDDDDDQPATVRTAKPKPVVPTESAGELLAAARELAGGGKLAAAAAAYQRLIDAHPSSSEARTAWISLGRVQAERGRHAAALTAFSRYLASGMGPLSEEAHFGKIQALHALGRAADRDRAVEALDAAHPRSVYLAKARALATR